MSEELRVSEEAAGERLDRLLTGTLDVPRNQVQAWIRDGLVRVDGQVVRSSHRVAAGEVIGWRRPDPPEDGLAPEAAPLAVLYQDASLIVLDKPPGLVVHPGAGRREGTLVHRLLHHFPETGGIGGPGRPGIVHRLDKDTSGALVVARSEPAYRALSRAFSQRRVRKDYLAVAWGVLRDPMRRLDDPLGRHPTRRKEMTVRADGRPAVTVCRRLAATDRVSLAHLRILTGRTHQIRVHLKHAGHPLLGDPVYGEARWRELRGAAQRAARGFSRPALHAWSLGLPHPDGDRWLDVAAPVPQDLKDLWRELGGRDEDWPATPPAGPPQG